MISLTKSQKLYSNITWTKSTNLKFALSLNNWP